MLKTLFFSLTLTIVYSSVFSQNRETIDLTEILPGSFSVYQSENLSSWIVSNPEIYVTPDGQVLYLGASGTDYKVTPLPGSWVEIDLGLVSSEFKSPEIKPASATNLPRLSKQIGFLEGRKMTISQVFTVESILPVFSPQLSVKKGALAEDQLSQFSTGKWVRFTLPEEGVFKLTASDLKNAGFSEQNDPRNLTVYSSAGFKPELMGSTEIPLLSEKPESAQWDPEQIWYFYSETSKGLTYTTTKNGMSFFDDIYTNDHFVFVGFKNSAGARIEKISGTLIANAEEVTTGKAMVWDNPDVENILKSGEKWYSQRISANSSMMITKKLLDYKTDTPVNLSSAVICQYDYSITARMSIKESGKDIVKDIITGGSNPANYNSQVATGRTVSGVITSLQSDRAILEYALVSPGSAIGWVDWFTLEYQRDLQLPKSKADFYFPGLIAEKPVNIWLKGFENSSQVVFNITDPLKPEVVNPEIMAGEVRFGWTLKPRVANRFFVFNKVSGVTPVSSLPSLQITSPELSSAFSPGINYIIVAPKAFSPAVKRLLAHREKQGWLGSPAYVEDIYLVYSGGKQNAPAIRKFLADVYEAGGQKLKNVLLFGDASFDVKGINGSKPFPGIIPTFESSESLIIDYTHCSDDEYSQISAQEQFSVGVGRIPVSTLTDAENMVDKLINYDLGSDQGDWRSLVTMVADDGLTAEGDDFDLHTSNAETVATQIPSYLSKRKIYTVSYPTITTSGGRRKPEVTSALLDVFNQGSAIINFSGHGNTKVWTHERVFDIGTFLPRLSNKNRLSFLITATCDFGKFDDPDDQSAAEMLVTNKETGVAGIFTTTRLVYTDKSIDGNNNLALNYFLFKNLYSKNENGRNLSIGEIFVLTKKKFANPDGQNKYKVDRNVRKFALLADPAMRLLLPEGNGFLTKNDTLVQSADTISFTTMKENVVSGKITDLQGNPDLTFNGTCFIRLNAEPVLVLIPEWKNRPPTEIKSYFIEGADIFRGLVTVKSGAFTLKFLAPRDVLTNTTPTTLSGYYWNSERSGLLVSPKIFYQAGNNSSKTDSLPPGIFLYVNDSTFSNGQKVSQSSTLFARIQDESGINTTGLGIGHQLSGVLNDDYSSAVDLSQFYTAEIDDYQKGHVEYPLSSLNAGEYTFKLKAWDAFNNGSESEIRFTVTNDNSLAVENLFPYPNPFADRVKFFFNHNQNQAELQVTLSIFTLNGLLIRTLKQNYSFSSGGELLEWDGRDSDHDQVANGIYLAKAIIKDLNSGKTETKILKLFKYN
ncbi:MAG: type IX secretion system sortase PorU [Bacteroidetes bacterium]|nr:type IX secretion system sortase PorU [Bacteroidota bacterium]